jgi:hypothetical protein
MKEHYSPWKSLASSAGLSRVVNPGSYSASLATMQIASNNAKRLGEQHYQSSNIQKLTLNW